MSKFLQVGKVVLGGVVLVGVAALVAVNLYNGQVGVALGLTAAVAYLAS